MMNPTNGDAVIGTATTDTELATPLLGSSSTIGEGEASVSAIEGTNFMETILSQRSKLIVSGILALFGAGLGLIPYIVCHAVSVKYFSSSDVADSGSSLLANQPVTTLAAGALMAVIGKAVMEGLSTWISHYAAFNILYDLRVVVARKLGKLPLGYFDNRTTGELKKILHEDIEMMELALAHMIPDMVQGLSTPVLAGMVLFYVHWKMALATILSGITGMGLFMWMMTTFSMDEFYAIMDKMNGIVIQYVNGIKVVKAFTRTDHSFQKFQEVVEELRTIYQTVSASMALPYAIMLTMMRSAAVTVIPTGIYLFLRGDMDLPTFVLFVVLGIGFNKPLQAAMMHGGFSFHLVYSASKRIMSVMDAQELMEPALPQIPKHHGVSFSCVTFGYSVNDDDDDTTKKGGKADDSEDNHTNDKNVLKDITFTAPENSVTALVGPSGSGKTTIAKLIARFWDVKSGEITVGGVNIKNMEVETLMDHVSFVFQDVFLFDDTVANNIAIGRRNATLEEVMEAAKVASCHDFIMSLPNGYDTIVGDNGVKLSGGQRQRLSIARSILKDSPIIVLDEATAYVDPENEALVQEALAGLLSKKSKTLIAVAHRLSTIAGADQILVVDKGSIVARGKHEELLKSCPLYQHQWEAHNSAREWQYGIGGGNGSSGNGGGDLVGDLKEKDTPLANIYAGLDPKDNVYKMVRNFVPPEEQYLFRRAFKLRALESCFITLSSYVVYLVLETLFDSSQHGSEAIDANKLWMYAACLTGSCIAQIMIGYIANLTGHKMLISIQSKLRTFLADFLRRLPMGYFTTNDTGTIDTLFTTNIMFMEPHHVLDVMVSALAVPTLIFACMLVFDWRMGLTLFSSIPICLVTLWYSDGVFDRVGKAQSKAQIEANARTVEYIQGIAVIRAFNLTGTRLDLFGNAIMGFRDRMLDMLKALIPPLIVFKGALDMGYAVLIVVGAHLLESGSLSPNSYLLFLIFGFSFYGPLQELAAFGEMFKLMQRCARRVGAFLQTEVLPISDQFESPKSTSIEFRNVTFSYDAATPVLNNVSFHIPVGTTTALVGPSGSGKTTVTSLISRFWDVNSGSVLVGEANVKNIGTNVLLNQITTVFQDVYLFKDTIHNNIKFGNPQASEEEVRMAAQAAQCDEFITALPDGYETVVGEGGSTLSGGEKQRISIARALLKKSPIVILDEATASLDPENEREIQLAIQALSERKTLIVVAHRLTTIQNVDQILVFEEGNLVQRGRHDDLVKQRDGLYWKLWEARTKSQGWKIAP